MEACLASRLADRRRRRRTRHTSDLGRCLARTSFFLPSPPSPPYGKSSGVPMKERGLSAPADMFLLVFPLPLRIKVCTCIIRLGVSVGIFFFSLSTTKDSPTQRLLVARVIMAKSKVRVCARSCMCGARGCGMCLRVAAAARRRKASICCLQAKRRGHP